jgi:MFS family permease
MRPHLHHVWQPVRLGRKHERWVYGIGGALLLSGVGWLIAHYFLAIPGEFGDPHHPSEPWWLRVHGAAAMGFLVVTGTVLLNHVVRAWHLRKNHQSGLVFLGLLGTMVLTGYALYYFGGEDTRPWISKVHWIAGLVATAVLPIHVVLGRHRKK